MPRTPKYRKIESYLRELLYGSEVGDLLPTVDELFQRFDVSGVQTVRDAYKPLVTEGLVEVQMRPRRRWTVAKVPPRVAEEDASTLDQWDLLAAQEALAAASQAIATAQANIARLLRDVGPAT